LALQGEWACEEWECEANVFLVPASSNSSLCVAQGGVLHGTEVVEEHTQQMPASLLHGNAASQGMMMRTVNKFIKEYMGRTRNPEARNPEGT
jgi:hypothetical protein